MSQFKPEPEPRKFNESALFGSADDWLLVDDSTNSHANAAAALSEASSVDANAESSTENRGLDEGDVAGLVASVVLRCEELAKAHQEVTKALEKQGSDLKIQQQQLSMLKVELGSLLEEHVVVLQKRTAEDLDANGESLKTELRRVVDGSFQKLQSEMVKGLQKAQTEHDQTKSEIHELLFTLELIQKAQQEAADNVRSLRDRLEAHITYCELQQERAPRRSEGLRYSGTKPAAAGPSTKDTQPRPPRNPQASRHYTFEDHKSHKAKGERLMFCNFCQVEMRGLAAVKDSSGS